MSPVIYQWNGEAMVPLARFARHCDKQFVVGEIYPLVVEEERSQTSHNHYFAAVHDAWLNLPEKIAPDFPTAEHLRKWALIKAGFRNEKTIVAMSNEQAQEIAALCDSLDEFAIVAVQGRVVAIYTAQSQSKRAMGAKRFQHSKTAVLDVLADMIGVDRDSWSTPSQITPSANLDRARQRANV